MIVFKLVCGLCVKCRVSPRNFGGTMLPLVVFGQPLDDGVTLPVCEGKVERSDQTIPCVRDRVDVDLGWGEGVLCEELIVPRDLTNVVVDLGVELHVESLLTLGQLTPGSHDRC